MTLDAAAGTSGLGTGASPRTRRVLGALLAALAVLAVVAVVLDRRDPAAYRDRAALPDCGSLETALDGTVPVTAATACFDEAVGGPQGAELLVVAYTDEGDPVRRTHRALPGGGVVVLTDATDDAFGPGGWSRQTCPAATALRELGDCSFEEL